MKNTKVELKEKKLDTVSDGDITGALHQPVYPNSV